jgi:hypothetical protein
MFAQSAVAATVIAAFMCLSAEVAQAQVPTINLDETCKAASGVMVSLMGGATSVDDLKICKDSETKARDQIIKDWGNYPASDREGCIQTRGYLPSYVEWLTCFEMNKVVRDARKQPGPGSLAGPLTNPDGSLTLPPVRSLGIMRY